jgi:hypothetical protein
LPALSTPPTLIPEFLAQQVDIPRGTNAFVYQFSLAETVPKPVISSEVVMLAIMPEQLPPSLDGFYGADNSFLHSKCGQGNSRVLGQSMIIVSPSPRPG